MRQPKDFAEYGKDGCCPSEWNHTPCMTGDYVFDGSVQRCKNSDMHKKLASHLAGTAYDRNSAYNRSPRD